MTTKIMKRSFYIPESYILKLDRVNPSPPFISSYSSSLNYGSGLRPYYQQSKLSLISTPLPLLSSPKSSVGIHTTDDDTLQVSSSLLSDKVWIK